jgi:hypothetical protein
LLRKLRKCFSLLMLSLLLIFKQAYCIIDSHTTKQTDHNLSSSRDEPYSFDTISDQWQVTEEVKTLQG